VAVPRPGAAAPVSLARDLREQSDALLEQLVEDIRRSQKYRNISADLVRRIGRAELEKRSSPKEAVKTTKGKLHQVAGAYLAGGMHYPEWLVQLRAARESGDAHQWQSTCARVMACHASTRERLPILERFYAETLAGLPPIGSVLDVACGLNPLSIPWMPLSEGATYCACDAYADMVAFVGEYLTLVPIAGQAHMVDVIGAPPRQPADVALVLKTIPCLEQVDPDAGARLLEALGASHILVSYPVHSLGGRGKGMAANYERQLRDRVAGRAWRVVRFEFPTELAFLISK